MNKCKLILPVVLSLYMIGCSNSGKTAQTDANTVKNDSESVNTVAAKKNVPGKSTVANKTEDKKTVQPNIKETQNTSESKDALTVSKTEDRKEISNLKGKIFIDVKTIDKTSTFPFGMSKENVIVNLKKLKLEVKSEIEITSSEDDPEWGNRVMLADGISFSFDKNNKLYCISVTQNILTSLNLKIGDSLEKTEQLYGKNHTKYNVENGCVYEYTFNNHYFRVFIKADKVTRLVVSKYKFFK